MLRHESVADLAVGVPKLANKRTRPSKVTLLLQDNTASVVRSDKVRLAFAGRV